MVAKKRTVARWAAGGSFMMATMIWLSGVFVGSETAAINHIERGAPTPKLNSQYSAASDSSQLGVLTSIDLADGSSLKRRRPMPGLIHPLIPSDNVIAAENLTPAALQNGNHPVVPAPPAIQVPPAPATHSSEVHRMNQLPQANLRYDNTPLATVVKEVAELSGISYTIKGQLDGMVNGALVGNPYHLLQNLSDSYEFRLSFDDGMWSIRPNAISDSTAAPKRFASDSTEGYWLDAAPINEIIQFLAREAGLQYFYNNQIASSEFDVTGHLQIDDPLQQMEDIALGLGLHIYLQDATVYVMTEQQLAGLPVEVMSYPLKYLRGSTPNTLSQSNSESSSSSITDFEKLQTIIQPMLTKGVGAIAFEEKTNTLLITDNEVKLRNLRELLARIDQPKPQIAVNVRILRISNSKGRKVGVDWEAALGEGVSISATQSLNTMFNLPDTNLLSKARETGSQIDVVDGIVSRSSFSTSADSSTRNFQDGTGLVFDSVQLEAIVHALNEADVVTQEACPTIITEDNEQGLIAIVDRFPIITSTLSQTSAGQNTSEDVRYKIDESDPDMSDNPEDSREIGVTLSVTPTLLPDGTVRMKLRPRVAKIVEFIPAATSNNIYPRVSESMAESISRVPSGKVTHTWRVL